MPLRKFLLHCVQEIMLGSGFRHSLCSAPTTQNASTALGGKLFWWRSNRSLDNASIPHAGLVSLFVLAMMFLASCQSADTYSNEELTGLYEDLEYIFEESGDFSQLNEVFHNESLISKSLDGVPGSEEFQETFRGNIKREFTAEGFFRDYVDANTTVTFIGLRGERGLFRVVRSYGQVEYLYLYPDVKDGLMGLSDLMFLTDGEPLSKSINRSYKVQLAESDSTYTDPIYEVLPEIQKIVTDPNIENVIENLDKLANDLPQEKMILLMDLHLCATEKPERLGAILDRFDALDPSDPTPYLHLLMSDFQEKNLKLPVIDELDERLGVDPYLNLYRAMYHRTEKQNDKALAAIEEGIKGSPETPELYFTYFDLLVIDKKYDKAIDAFETFQTETQLNPADFLVFDPVEDFLLSDQFESWVKDYPLSATADKHWRALKDSLNVN